MAVDYRVLFPGLDCESYRNCQNESLAVIGCRDHMTHYMGSNLHMKCSTRPFLKIKIRMNRLFTDYIRFPSFLTRHSTNVIRVATCLITNIFFGIIKCLYLFTGYEDDRKFIVPRVNYIVFHEVKPREIFAVEGDNLLISSE